MTKMESARLVAHMESKSQKDFSRKLKWGFSGTGSRQDPICDTAQKQALSEATAECSKFQSNENNTKGGNLGQTRYVGDTSRME